jgi:hypothetical protein
MEIAQSRCRPKNLWLLLVMMIYISAWLMPVYLKDGRLSYADFGFRIVHAMIIDPMYPFGMMILCINGLFGGCWLLSYLGVYRSVAVPTGTLALLGTAFFFPSFSDADDGVTLGPGYYTWLFSMASLVVLAFCGSKEQRKGQARIPGKAGEQSEKPVDSGFFWEDSEEDQATYSSLPPSPIAAFP